MKTKSLASLFVLLLFFIFVPSVFAVSLSIENVPSNVTDQEFSVQVTVTGASSGQNFLRSEIYKDGTTNYFGETKNGDTWYGGSDGKQYPTITIVDSKTPAVLTLAVRIGSPSQTEYPGPGTYKLRIKRYTSSGNAASSDSGDPVDLQIAYAPPTPTSAPTATSSPTRTPTPIQPSPTPTKTPTPIKSPTPSKVPTPSKTPTPGKIELTSKTTTTLSKTSASSVKSSPTPSHGPVPTAVLGASTSAKASQPTNKFDKSSQSPKLKEAEVAGFNPAVIFIGLGVIVLGSVGGLLFKNYRS